MNDWRFKVGLAASDPRTRVRSGPIHTDQDIRLRRRHRPTRSKCHRIRIADRKQRKLVRLMAELWRRYDRERAAAIVGILNLRNPHLAAMGGRPEA